MRITLFLFLLLAISCSGYCQTGTIAYISKSGFIENKGQVIDQNHMPNSTPRYVLNTPGINIVLNKKGFSYDTYTPQKPQNHSVSSTNVKDSLCTNISYSYHRIDVELVGINSAYTIDALEPLPEYANYYLADSTAYTHVGMYARIVYRNVYPGIDLEFTSVADSSAPFKYNFIVHPGADARLISLKYSGADNTLLIEGKIEIETANGVIAENIPLSFDGHSTIDVTYKKTGPDTYGFNVPLYDTNTDLVIDPEPRMAWSTYSGGNSADYAFDITLLAGKPYVTGRTHSNVNIATAGSFQSTLQSSSDYFIMKYDSSGNKLWSTYCGYLDGIDATCLVAGDSGCVYFSGMSFNSTDPYALYKGYLAKFDSTGAQIWNNVVAGSHSLLGDFNINDIAFSKGYIYLTGVTTLDTLGTTGVHQTARRGDGDAFIAKYSASGAKIWFTYMGGPETEAGKGIACDSFGDIYITGCTESTQGIATASSHQYHLAAGTDIFLAKFDSAGTRKWGTYIGGKADEIGSSIAVSNDGYVYITGISASDTGIVTITLPGHVSSNGEPFVLKFDTAGHRIWGVSEDNSHEISSDGIAVDDHGNVYVSGTVYYPYPYAGSSNLSTYGSYRQISYGGEAEGFILRYSAFNGRKLWGSYVGGRSKDILAAITIDNAGSIYMTGSTNSVYYIATPVAYQDSLYNTAFSDAFVAKLSDSCYTVQMYIDTQLTLPGCPATDNGTIVLSVTGGVGPLSYSWSTGDTVSSLANLAPGYYSATATDVNGCKAYSSINLQRESVPYTHIDTFVCDTATFLGYGYGQHRVTLADVRGCDSILFLDIEQKASFHDFYSRQICEGEGVWVSNRYYDQPGLFNDTVFYPGGCPYYSTVEIEMNLEVTIDTIRGDVLLTDNDSLVTYAAIVQGDSANYFWIVPCADVYVVGPGLPDSILRVHWQPGDSCDILLIVTSGACADTFILAINNQLVADSIIDTTIIDTTISGLVGIESPLKVIPNPVSDVLTVEGANFLIGKAVTSVFDVQGRLLLRQELVMPYQLDVSDLSAGIYAVTIHDDRGVYTLRFVKGNY